MNPENTGPTGGHQYRVTAFKPINAGGLLALVLRVTVDKDIDWVRRHADEIAQRGVQQDPVARSLTTPIVALNVEAV